MNALPIEAAKAAGTARPESILPSGGHPHVDPVAYRAAMRELAAGVTIIAAGSGEHRRGLTATAVCSVSAEPPTLLVCINRATDGHAAISLGGAFSVNIIGPEHRALADRFAGRNGIHGMERFAEGRWDTLATGAPVLTDALAVFDCRLVHAVDWTTHTVFLGTVVATRISAERPALVYRAGSFSHLPAA